MTGLRALTALVLLGTGLSLCGCDSQAPAGASSAVPGRGIMVAAVGDSITSGLGVDPGQAWLSIVGTANGWQTSNLGVPGAGFLALGDTGYTYNNQIGEAVQLHPQILFISASDNDVDLPQSGDLGPTAAVDLRHIRDMLPNTVVIGLSALSGLIAENDLATGNQEVRQAVESVNGQWIDLGQPLQGDTSLLQSDGEHPTVAGQETIAQLIIKALDAIQLPTATPTA